MMSAVVLETCWGDNVIYIYILQIKKLGASSWSQKLINTMSKKNAVLLILKQMVRMFTTGL
jgi:hypothetical protein